MASVCGNLLLSLADEFKFKKVASYLLVKHVCLCLSLCVYISVRACVHVFLCLYACVCMYVFVYMAKYVCLCVYV